MPQRVLTTTDVTALAARIMALRRRPLVVVSTDPRTDGFAIDLDALAGEVHDIADIYLISTGDLTRELDSRLPDKAQVYGGAGRSYPVDFCSDPDWRRSPLRFPGAKATQNLIGDVIGHAGTAGLFDKGSARRIPASGVVRGFLADDTRALVEIEGRGLATVSRELTYPPISLGWALHKGQRTTGVLDLDSKLFLVEQAPPTTAELAAAFPHRCVTLALVREVTPQRATLLLHPAAEFTLGRIDVSPNPLDTVDLLVAEGDVVAARVTHLSDGSLHLSLADVDDDEPIVPPLALTAGGRPWLEEGRALELHTTDAASDLAALDEAAAASAWAGSPGGEADAAATTPVPAEQAGTSDEEAEASAAPASDAPARGRPMPGPGRRVVTAPILTSAEQAEHVVAPTAAAGTALHSTQLSLAQEQAKVAELERRLADAGADESSLSRLRERASGAEARLREELAERGALERELKELKEQRRLSTHALRDARKTGRPTPAPAAGRADRRTRWSTDEEWIRHEVYLAWVDRVAPTERTVWPLGDYAMASEFAASIDALDEGQFDKAMKAVVDAATGRIREIPGRVLHTLREGDGATARDVVRADGAKCQRAYIEQNTPAARRLHFWSLPGGAIELSRIVTHDDMRP